MQTGKNNLTPPVLQADFSIEDFMASLSLIDMALDSPKANSPEYRSYIQTHLRELYLKADELDIYMSNQEESMYQAQNEFATLMNTITPEKPKTRKGQAQA